MNEFFLKKINSEYYKEDVEKIINGLSCKRFSSFRINRLKTTLEKVSKVLDDVDIEYENKDCLPDAFVLKNYDVSRKKGIDRLTGLSIENFEIYKKGMIYMQSLSSMVPVYILNPQKGENILDMCAAPGGKTTMIQSLTNNKVNLTACELHKDRYERLKYNCEKQGANVYLLNQNAIDLNDMLKFDKILIDAPCSGSGILDLNEDNNMFTEELINKCVKTQKKLIQKASKLIKKEGEVIYSTCSILKAEDEEIIDFAIKNGFILDCLENIKDSKNGMIKILPNEYYEGFFIAKLRKK